jgi:hypothetical protein
MALARAQLATILLKPLRELAGGGRCSFDLGESLALASRAVEELFQRWILRG